MNTGNRAEGETALYNNNNIIIIGTSSDEKEGGENTACRPTTTKWRTNRVNSASQYSFK